MKHKVGEAIANGVAIAKRLNLARLFVNEAMALYVAEAWSNAGFSTLKNRDLFELFDKIAANISHAANLLVAIVARFTNLDAWAKEVHELEKNGNLLTHDIMKNLNRTFITPIDKEDIHALASKLDDVLDFIWCAAKSLAVFQMKESTEWAITMSKDLLRTVEYVQKAINELKEQNYHHVREYCIGINQLENDVERDFKDALGHLFEETNDPFLIIKWKEIYGHFKGAADKCEDVAYILEGITLKNA